MDASDVRQFFVASLQNSQDLSDLDTSPDSNFDDLVIKPHMLFSQALFNYIADYKATISLGNLANMTMPQLTAIASRLLVTPNTGSTLSLQIAIFLNANNNTPLQVLQSDSFRTSDGTTFNPIQTYVFVPTNLPTVTINGQTLYVASITTVSQNASKQITANQITSWTINHPALVNVTNLGSSPAPVLADTNAQLITKMQNAGFTRNLINRPSIFNALTKAFPNNMISVYSVGYGDPEMQRDIVPAGQAWSFHVGGTIDVYVNTALQPCIITATGSRIAGNIYRVILKRYKGYDVNATDNSNPHPGLLYGWELVELPDNSMPGISTLPVLPFLYIDFTSRTLSITDNESQLSFNQGIIQTDSTTLDYKVNIVNLNSANLRFSIYEQIELDFYLSQDVGDSPTFTIPYFTMNSLEDVQDYISEPQTIFHCADTLIKSFIPIEIRDFSIKYDKNYSVDVAGLTISLCNIINNWNSPEHIRMSTLLSNVPVPVRIGELGEDFPINADLITPDNYITAVPSQLDSDVYATLPTYVEVVQHNIDGSEYHFVTTDQICSIEKPQLSSTRRTVKYFIQPENLHFVPSSW
jgi:hypothetical protein